MEYANFFTEITLRYHVIYENWPVARFCTPGNLTLLELRMLHQALFGDSVTPLFRRLSDEEWDALDLEELQKRYNTFAPTVARPLLDDVEHANNDSALDEGLSSSEANAPGLDPLALGSGATALLEDGQPQGIDPNDVATPTAPPARGGNRVSLGSDQAIARPEKQRKQRADAGLTKEQWAAKKAAIQAEKDARKKNVHTQAVRVHRGGKVTSRNL